MAVVTQTKQVLNPSDVETYFTLNKQMNDIKKQVEKLKEGMKNTMITNDIDSIQVGDYVVTLTDRVTKTTDNDMLSQVLVSKGIHKECAEVKLVPNKDKVLQAIADGKISQTEYDLCQKESHSAVFNVKKK